MEVEAKKVFSHEVVLCNRQKLSLSGVERVDVATPTQFECVAINQRLQVLGKDMEVNKLDVDSGCVVLSGQINSINYLGEKKSVFKRLFK